MFLAGNPFTPHATAMPEAVLFWILAPLTVLAALSMLFVRKAVHSALLLAFVMIGLAVFYIAGSSWYSNESSARLPPPSSL